MPKTSQEHPRADIKRQRIGMALLVIGGLAVLARATTTAWVAEDALITFRTIDNFVNGYGLRWNVDERVQVYTHPLWMLLNSVPYYFTREVPYSTTIVALICSVGGWVLAARHFVTRPLILGVCFLLPFLLSPSLYLYATSGFANSLAYLLMAGFALVFFSGRPGKRTTLWLFLLAALGTLNRLDYGLLFIPPLIMAMVISRRPLAWRQAALGLAPLIAWFLFALIYYGSPIPNTAPAKVSSEIPVFDYLREGNHYALDLFSRDPVGAGYLIAGFLVALLCGTRYAADRSDAIAGRCASLSTGAFVYCLYVLRVGGDFLSGRLWSIAIFTCLLVIAYGMGPVRKLVRSSRRLATGVVTAALLLASAVWLVSHQMAKVSGRGEINRISRASLFLLRDGSWGATDKVREYLEGGTKWRDWTDQKNQDAVIVNSFVGFWGYAAGPRVRIIDLYALTDPFLARMPLDTSVPWRVGHLQRVMPEGYFEARRSGNSNPMHPQLRGYYDKVRLVVSGPLFSGERLAVIPGLLLGGYDEYVQNWRRETGGTGRKPAF